MQGVVTLLPPALTAATEALWAELDHALGLRGVFVTPFPHFSFHVAQGYHPPRLAAALQSAAAHARPLTVTTTGLGVFTGPVPVLYLPVVRTPELSALHAAVWAAVEPAAHGSQAYYAPAHWMPHITLAAHDLSPATAAEAVRLLGGRSFDWRFAVDHLAHVDDAGGAQHVAARFNFAP